jgi:hypothetical protein
MEAINERKGRMEEYANLVHKASEQPLINLIVMRHLLMNAICRRAPRFEVLVGNERTFFGIYVSGGNRT